MMEPSVTARTLAALREEFDRSYAVRPVLEWAEQRDTLLAIRVGADRYAIRVREITGLAKNRRVVAFPSPIGELLGVASVRGVLAPVYSLAALLGYTHDAREETGETSWLALCGGEERAGLAFAGFEGHFVIPAADVFAATQEDASRGHVKETVRLAGSVRGVISIPSIVETIKRRCAEDRVYKER